MTKFRRRAKTFERTVVSEYVQLRYQIEYWMKAASESRTDKPKREKNLDHLIQEIPN